MHFTSLSTRLRTRKLLFALSAAAALLLPGTARATTGTTLDVPAALEAHLQFLAHDDLAGRETGTPGGNITAHYVAAVLRGAGLEPAGSAGDFLQPYALVAQRVDPEALRLELRGAGPAPTLFVPRSQYLLGGFNEHGFDLSGGLAFAGHGVVHEESGLDEYDGLDVSGRWVVVLDGRPEGRTDLRMVSHWRAKRSAASARGAVGLIVAMAEGRGLVERLAAVEHSMLQGSLGLPPEEGEAAVVFPVITLTLEGVGLLAAATGLDFEAEREARDRGKASGRLLPELTLTLQAPVVTDSVPAYNILGRLRGSDPVLADEVVIFTAHNDHVGVLPDGRINNGADDNASGTAVLLAVAQLMAQQPPPRRSIVFCSVSAEEKGLLGSEWWCRNPTLPLESVVGNINIDMVGRNDPDAIGATPSPQHADYNTLVQRAEVLGPQSGLDVTWTAPRHGNDRVDNYYQRSDHYNFAKRGIPAVFFFAGLHEDYHKPTDELHKLDRTKLARMVSFLSDLARDVADTEARPARVEGER